MERFLALSTADRARAFEQAGARRGLPAGSVEKDFWVCLMLRELFALPSIGDQLTFKGGTSLSKAWGLIDRFSEDIDLTIERDGLGFSGDKGPEAATTGQEQRRRLDGLKLACRGLITTALAPALRARLTELLRANESWSLESDSDDPDGQTLLFAYPRLDSAVAPSYLKPVVKLEFGARSDPWPAESCLVTSIIAEEFPALIEVPQSSVRALLPERTFWEKVLLLHEEGFRPAGTMRRARMARHYYDAWRLIEAGVAPRAAADVALFDRVVAHRRVFFKYGWVDYDTMKRGAIAMVPRVTQVDDWRRDYVAMQGEMFATTPPAFDEILTAVDRFQSEFNGA